ncbi:MAG: helix-turn-helix domain-containing protein [Granulosicoccaceae bacterium]
MKSTSKATLINAGPAALEYEITHRSSAAIRYLEHGYPSELVRWHHHEECEIHLIVETSGKVFVGDYIGTFAPGQLILTGPHVPHNWISHLPEGKPCGRRDMAVHFQQSMVQQTAEHIPELRKLEPLFEHAKSGVAFHDIPLAHAQRDLAAIRDSSGVERVSHFFALLNKLNQSKDYQLLSTVQMKSSADEQTLVRINTVVDYVMRHYTQHITVQQVAQQINLSETHFSRFFRKATGLRFIAFLNRIRIQRACELLGYRDDQITSIAYAVGYNTLANFNRHFQELKGVTPREYRTASRERMAGDERYRIQRDNTPE